MQQLSLAERQLCAGRLQSGPISTCHVGAITQLLSLEKTEAQTARAKHLSQRGGAEAGLPQVCRSQSGLPPPARPLPARPSSSSAPASERKPPGLRADVPFFLLPLSHTRGHGSSLRPLGPHHSNFCLNFLICEVGAVAVPALKITVGTGWADSVKPHSVRSVGLRRRQTIHHPGNCLRLRTPRHPPSPAGCPPAGLCAL